MVLKRTLGCLFVLTLASGILWAQDGPKAAHTNRSAQVTPMQAQPTTTKTIFSNFGPSLTNSYNPSTGYYVLGPNNSVGLGEQWIGLPFTPLKNSSATIISAAIGVETGYHAVNLGIYSDNSGTVGTLLASSEATKIPAFGTCCQTVNVEIPATALTAGTQYWIVATTDDVNAPNFTGVWMSTNSSTISYNPSQEGWFDFSGNVPAAAVKGTEQ